MWILKGTPVQAYCIVSYEQSYLSSVNQEIAAFVRQKDKDGSGFTQADIAYINQYVGYGGMWKLDEELSKERGLYEYYTPIEVVQKMVGLAHRYGYTGGPVLEPSCGIGRFLHYFSPETQADRHRDR